LGGGVKLKKGSIYYKRKGGLKKKRSSKLERPSLLVCPLTFSLCLVDLISPRLAQACTRSRDNICPNPLPDFSSKSFNILPPNKGLKSFISSKLKDFV